MDRRQALKSMGAAALAQLSSTDLLALGRETHTQLRDLQENDRHLFKTLDPLQNETVVVVSELIIPETDTPGAKAARVNEFVDMILSDWFTDRERTRFLRGLAALDTETTRFVSLAEADQIEVLAALEKEALAHDADPSTEEPASPADRPFFMVMKWLTLFGYYTSKTGMEEELHHEVFPGSYDGCAPVRKIAVREIEV